jgi:glycogen synthase
VRILYWSELFWPYIGGPEVFARSLLPALRDRGYEITILTSHDHLDLPDRSELDGFEIHRLPMREALVSGNLSKIAEVTRRIRQLKQSLAPDIIHLNGVGSSALLHFMTEASHPVPLLASLRTEVLGSQKAWKGSILERTLRQADWVTAVSWTVLEQARQLVPAISPRSTVVYNFIAVERPLQPYQSDSPVIVCLGRLIAAKGFDIALRALPSVLARHPDIRFVIAGDGPERSNLERLACDLRLEHAVQFAGPIAPKDVPNLLASATIAVLPSRREGLPMVAVEAGMMARPVVAARTGGMPEVVVDGQTGILVPKEDTHSLGKAICALLDQPAMAAEMGRRARDLVTAKFARQECVDTYSSVYEKLNRKADTPICMRNRAEIKEEDRGNASKVLSQPVGYRRPAH